MNKSGLLIRLAVVIVFAAIAVGIISAQVFYRLTYLTQIDLANSEISQLSNTVKSTASIAAYLEDEELLAEVVNGLATNGVVMGAQIKALTFSKSSEKFITTNFLKFDLVSPFEPDRVVGELRISPDLLYIKHKAQEISSGNTKALALQASVVTLIAILLTFLLITKPMVTIANEMHCIEPGSSSRLSTPLFHEQSELGALVQDINLMLEKGEKHFSEEKALKNNLEILEKQFRMLFEKSISPIVLMEPMGSILIANNAFTKMLSSVEESLKKTFGPLMNELFFDSKVFLKSAQNSLSHDEVFTGEFKLLKTKSNNDVWLQVIVTKIISDDFKEYHQINLHDISKRKKELEILNIRANYDKLTSLTNRHAAESAMEKLASTQKSFAIIMLDLNGFKNVNDRFGHDAGDQVLKYAANQIKSVCRKDDIVCRWGGDEFVVVLRNMNKKDITKLALKIKSKLSAEFYLEEYNESVFVNGCMGVALYPQDEMDIKTLIRLADHAMYSAKEQKINGDSPVVFSSELTQ